MMNLTPTFLDVETTTFNKGHRFDPRNLLVSYVYNNQFHYINDPDFRTNQQMALGLVVGFNVKFDLHWLDVQLDDVKIWDCQLAEFVLNGQRGAYQSLDELLEVYGLPAKRKHEVHAMWEAGVQTTHIPVDVLKDYNLGDVEPLQQVYEYQRQRVTPLQEKLIFLMGEDMKVLIEMERNGILFNRQAAETRCTNIKTEVLALEEALAKFLPPIQHGKFNWDSGDHLSALLYGANITFDYAEEMDAEYQSGLKKGQKYVKRTWHEESVTFPQRFKPLEGTEVKKTLENGPGENHFYQVDDPTLKQIKPLQKQDQELVLLLIKRAKTIKLAEMLESLFKQFDKYQWENNLIHPNYNQNVVVTGRLSSSSPNMQNQPPEIDEFFISRYA